jgi:hypothetical protein
VGDVAGVAEGQSPEVEAVEAEVAAFPFLESLAGGEALILASLSA